MVNSRFTESVISFMRDAISKAQGNEVFFGGVINQEGVVISVEVAARGHKSAVPVQFEIAQRAHVLIHNHPSGGLQPSEADLAVASHAAERSQGFYIVNNDISDVYVVVEPVKPKKIVKLDLDSVAHYISAGGPLDTSSDFFEERPSQIDLLRNICSVLNDNGIGVFEAGTGVGKSYGYLIPAILWAFQNKQRIVISTGTINLQQQLAEKDLPAAKKITGKDIKSILLKGRQNYVCLRRLNDVAKEPDLFFEGDELNIMEIKAGEKAISGSSGLFEHYRSFFNFTEYLSKDDRKEEFLKDTENVIKQIRLLDLWSNSQNRNEITLSRTAKPSLVFILSNYNPRSTLLDKEIVKIKEFMRTHNSEEIFDIYFATSSFTGYGLYDPCMQSLESVCEQRRKIHADMYKEGI